MKKKEKKKESKKQKKSIIRKKISQKIKKWVVVVVNSEWKTETICPEDKPHHHQFCLSYCFLCPRGNSNQRKYNEKKNEN